MNPQDSDLPGPIVPTADTANGPAPEPAAAQEATAVVDKRRRAPRKKPVVAAADAAGAAMPLDLPAVAANEPAAEPARAERDSAAEATEPGQEGQSAGDSPAPAEGGAQAREGGRRNRNRRRGRRGGDGGRELAGEGVSSADGETVPVAVEPRLHLPQPEVGEVFANVVSGAYDVDTPPAEGEVLPLVPPKRVLAAEPDAPKLQKVLAQAGIGSRRDMEQLVAEGRITVNGEPAHVASASPSAICCASTARSSSAHRTAAAARAGVSQAAGEVVTHDDRSTGRRCSAACRACRRASGNR